jgi:pyruvate/2-oxoglutarate/acetoin dehydrogenase E1 component
MSEIKPHYRSKPEFAVPQSGKRFRRAIAEALSEEMIRDERIYLIGEDIGKNGGSFGVTLGMYDQFGPKRVIDAPISELAQVGIAAGSCLMGMRPIVEMMFLDFLFLAMDQVINTVAKMRYIYGEAGKMPMVIRVACGAGLQAGPTHGQGLYSMFAHVPGIKVVMPSTPYDAKGLLITSIRDDDCVLFCENMRLYGVRGEVPDETYTIPLGKAEVKREGNDVTIVATMALVYSALAAAEELNQKGISAEVLDLRSLVPLDKDTMLNSVKKTHRLVVVDEGPLRCGLQSEIASIAAEEAFDDLDAPIQKVGNLNAPIPFSPVLEEMVLPNKHKIIEAVLKILS